MSKTWIFDLEVTGVEGVLHMDHAVTTQFITDVLNANGVKSRLVLREYREVFRTDTVSGEVSVPVEEPEVVKKAPVKKK